MSSSTIATKMLNGAAFLHSVIEAFPYRIHTVLTDNGTAFADLPKNRSGISRQWGPNMFNGACLAHGIEHKTKPYHPWTNGQAERMNRTIKDATTKVFHSPDLESLKAHVLAFVAAYDFAKHLKALRWRTPIRHLCQSSAKEPSIFKLDPRHLIRDQTASLTSRCLTIEQSLWPRRWQLLPDLASRSASPPPRSTASSGTLCKFRPI